MNRFLTIVRMSGKPVKPKLKLGGGLVKMGTAANIKEHGGNVPSAAAPAADAARLEAAAPPKAAVAPKPPAASAAPKPPAAAPAPKPPAAAPAPKPAAAAPAASAAPPPPPQQKNLSKYDDQLQDYAIEILGEESNNPYKNKTERPIFPLQTRLGFQTQILKVYNSFAKIPDLAAPPDFDACKKLGAGAQEQVETYEYQKFVRDYMRQASPYRGLLVYHGLGSGKTCSAIAAAEALFSVSKKKIIVMTPFSLRDNFIREVSFCGFRHFRLQNHWVPLEKSNPTIALFAKEILGLSEKFIKKATTFWVPDFEKPPNFQALETDKRQQIIKQLVEQVTSRIEFINYNGITASKLKELACRPLDASGNGPFDDKVIVVDEIHNLTRLMQGTIEPYLTSIPGLKRKVPMEPVTPGRWEPALCKKATDPRRPYLTNYKRGYLLYRLILGAKNSKIIGLSGTPLINFPEEIAILMNLLGGYIHTSSFTVTPGGEANKKEIQAILQQNPYVDFEEVNLQGMNMHVMLTCLPEGMMKVEDAEGVLGVQRVAQGAPPTPTIQELTQTIFAAIKAKGMKVTKEAEFKSEPLLPPIGEEFRTTFLEADGTTLKNKIVLRKRLQGLISYYRGSKKELMPAVTKDELVRVPFTPYAQAEYLRVRGAEVKQQLEQKKKPAQGGVAGAAVAGKMGNLWAELYELAKMKSPNSYRMFSRQACNFAFPEGIARPRPSSQKDAVAEIGEDKEIVDGGDAAAAADELPLTQGEAEGDAKLEGDEQLAQKEDDQLEEGEKAEFVEEARAAGDEEAAEEAEKEGQCVLIGGLEAVAPGPEAAAAPGLPKGEKKSLTAANIIMRKRAENCKRGTIEEGRYLEATARAKSCLRTFATDRLRLYAQDPAKPADIRTRFAEGEPINEELLPKYSPKYAKILENILSAPGSSLVYSQFLDMEGIGIFKEILQINDFQPIVIEADGEGGLRFTSATKKSLAKGPAAYRYLSFTGGEDREKRSLYLKIFNAKYSVPAGGAEAKGSFSDLPKEMSDDLVAAGFKGNMSGELCRVFCITSAGAEGLSLKNVRRVHIMEPYWNPVRTDQVKGRAVRICSHIDLDYHESPELNQRTVEVFTYCATFAKEALLHKDGSAGYPMIDANMINTDGIKPADAVAAGFIVPDGAKDYIVTSDEYLYSLSENKKKLLQNIQDLMKTSAVDCQINEYENEEDGLGCITIPGNPTQYAYHPVLKTDISETSTKFKEDSVNGSAEASAEAEAGAEAKAAAAPAQAQAKAKATFEASIINYDGINYLCVPVEDKKTGSILRYDMFSEGDTKRKRVMGTMLPDAQGNLSADITIFKA
jgi:hypothetical protein